MKAYIFCNGPISDYGFLKNKDFSDCLVICADGGMRHTERLKITPDVIVGDFDSAKSRLSDISSVECPTHKDYTDTERCVDLAIERGCKEIELIGAFGGRVDHEFSHYCLMAYALKKGASLVAVDEKNEAFMKDKPFRITDRKKKYVSFFAYGGTVEGLWLKGLKYELEGVSLRCDTTLSVSNEFLSDEDAEISFDKGILLVILSED